MITMELVENGHVAHYKISDPWTVSELVAFYPQETVYRDAVKYKIHAFADLTQAHKTPPNMLAARKGNPSLTHPNSGQLVLVGISPLYEAIASTIFRITHYTKAKLFLTEAEAWVYLRELITNEQ